jgi:hypothetical protein
VTLYRKDGDTLEPSRRSSSPTRSPAGPAPPASSSRSRSASIGADGLVVRVDDDGLGGSAQFECAESNNEAAWIANPC